MKKFRVYIARIFLLLSIVFVLLTVIIPGRKIALGQVILKTYKGLYSLVPFIVCLFIYFICARNMEEDIKVNRLKFLLSISFLISLISNIIFLE